MSARERVTAAFKFSKRERERSRTLERTYKFGFVEYKNLLQASLIELFVQKGRKSNFIMYKKKKKSPDPSSGHMVYVMELILAI